MKSEGYDAAYKKDKYLRHYSNPHRWGWLARWKACAKLIEPKERILEVGCGTGQLANLLFDHQKRNYTGFDFSPEGIKVCKSLGLDPMNFYVGDAYNKANYNLPYDVFLCCEVLEHLKDFEVLKNVQSGIKMVITLPDFKADNHLFHIDPEEEKGINQIYDRYLNYISIVTINKVDAWYVIHGVKI